MDVTFHNLMEDIVLNNVEAVLRAGGGCCCELCKADAAALALNHLPPRYVVTDMGRMMVKLSSYEAQFRADVLAALSEAAARVHSNPRHGTGDTP